MSLLVRKVDKALWLKNPPIDSVEDCPSDAITICIKTKSNKLSVWRIDSIDNIDEAVLAIASALDHLESIDVVAIPKNEFNDIKIVDSPGRTNVPDLVGNHYDLTDITFKKLGIIATSILTQAKGNLIKRYTKNDLKKILNKAIANNRLSPEKLI
jgi:hypothetical protein